MSLPMDEILNIQKASTSPLQKITDALAILGREKKTTRQMRDLIMGLESVMFSMSECKTAKDFDTRHHFEPGTYMRELFIPKDTILTGRIHKTAHLNILSQGKLTVWTENGMKTLIASTVIKSLPGIKRVGYAHEDSVWITVHHNPSDERDLAKVESRLFADTFDEAYISSQRTFDDAILFLGFTEAEVKTMSENPDDQINYFFAPRSVRVGPSTIHGQGVFATRPIAKNAVIAVARIAGMRTFAGRFVNHDANPNAEMLMRSNGDVDLVAIREIQPDEEILNDYYWSYTKTRNKKGTQLCQL